LTGQTSKLIGRREFLKRGGAAAALTVGNAIPGFAASEWPSRAVTIVVPYAAGGHTDLMARLLAQHLTQAGKTAVVLERSGGNGVPAAMSVAQADPDGATVMFGPSAPYVITPLLQKVSFSSDSFVAINNFGGYPWLVGIRPSLPIHSISDLIAYAKAHPGRLNYSTAGVGSSSHLLTALFAAKAGISVVNVPYRGAIQGTAAVTRGEVDFCFSGIGDMMPFLESQDKMRILATTGRKRLEDSPHIPMLSETMPEYEVETWNGLVGPRNMPKPLVDQFAALVRDAAFSPPVVKRLKAMGISPAASTPEEFAKIIAADKHFYGEAVKAAGLV